MPKEPVPGKILYIREDIPSTPVPPYDGETYEDLVPATFDIAERAERGINVLTGATNPLADYELYCNVDFRRNPPIMYNSFDDWCQPKFMEALPLLRVVTGSKNMDKVDRVWMDVTLKSIGPDGLVYIPLEGRPWGRTKAIFWAEGTVARADGTFTSVSDPTVKQLTHPGIFCNRMLSTMLVYYLRDGNPMWKEAIEKMIDRFLELAIHKEETGTAPQEMAYCYFPTMHFEPNARYDKNGPQALSVESKTKGMTIGPGITTIDTLPGLEVGEQNGRIIQGASQFYKVTGYEPARELARKLTRFMRFRFGYFSPDGKFQDDKHFHAHTIYLLAMLEYALAIKDVSPAESKELLEYLHTSYEWARSPAAGSSSLIGFFPTFARPNYEICESCEIADMIAIALKLSQSDAYDYYADAERWTRNHFAESQLTETDWIYCFSEKQPVSAVGFNETADRVPERNVGGYTGSSKANDWGGPGILHCCTGNGTRTIYYIWQHILDYADGHLRINMLLNRAAATVDVHSYIPYQGQVDLKIKTDCKSVSVHAPEWIETGSDEILVTVDGVPRTFSWEGRYIDLGSARRGTTVEVVFPISERRVKETIGGIGYTLVVKGNSVVYINPPSTNCPFYRRPHYRENRVHWRKMKRFVAEKPIMW